MAKNGGRQPLHVAVTLSGSALLCFGRSLGALLVKVYYVGKDPCWMVEKKRRGGRSEEPLHLDCAMEPKNMHETPTSPVPCEPSLPPENVLNTSLPPPQTATYLSGWLKRFGKALLAGPRAVFRHPWRSLSIAVLLLLIGTGSSLAGMWLWASYHLRAGRIALQRYHVQEAVQHLQTVLSVWPQDPEALFLAARAARRAGNYDTADHFLDLYQEIRKEDPQLNLERICLRAERGEPDAVASYCRMLVEQNDPAASLVYEALAQGYVHNYQLQRAQKILNHWLEREPNNPQALHLRGQIYDLELRHADAIQTYRAALAVDPNLDAVRLHLCDALMELGSIEEAQPELEYLRRRLPDHPKIQVYLARVQDRQGHSEAAEKILDAVLADYPHFAPALLDRGILALRAGQFGEAEKYLREAVQRDPSNYQAHDRLAFCLEQNGKLAEADKEREHLKQMEKDIEELQAILRGKMEQTPHQADLHYKIGMISLRAGSVAEGLRWLHSALKE